MKKKTTPYLSVVMPAYNEAPNFKAGLLKPSYDFLKKQKYSWEVIFVDDGSTDSTKKLLTNFCKEEKHSKLLAIPHGGRAAAMREGMLAATGKYILYTDFDQSTALEEVDRFLPFIKTKFDLVIGARGSGTTTRQDSYLKKIRAKAFVFIASKILLSGIEDINCGFKLYRKEPAHKIFSSLLVSKPKNLKHAYMGAIDSEILFLAKKFKYKIKSIPVNWVRYEYVSHLNWKEPVMIIMDLVTMRTYDMLGRYNKKND